MKYKSTENSGGLRQKQERIFWPLRKKHMTKNLSNDYSDIYGDLQEVIQGSPLNELRHSSEGQNIRLDYIWSLITPFTKEVTEF